MFPLLARFRNIDEKVTRTRFQIEEVIPLKMKYKPKTPKKKIKIQLMFW